MKRLREFCFAHHITALWQVPLSDYTSFRIGGTAEAMLFPPSEGSFVMLLRFLLGEKIPFCVMGNGSNLLVTDEGVAAAVVSTRHIRSVSVNGTSVTVGCGTPLSVLCRRLAESSLGGGEALYGIPGTMGGAVYMNAGAYGVETADLVRFVSVVDTKSGECKTLSCAECGFSYRHSVFMEKRQDVILSVELLLSPRREELVREDMKRYLSLRMEKQPTALPSAGSAFRRPEGEYAARLIS
ncbi:MAG: UDP-N-acetylmuramate dehydrogenase, partial [Clostridia bacterium]|nr:UDP-N-acetylmuramate dehydrogenase [Clostridia bacterium]